ncbi:uncharacterized protein LOC117173471 isoform X2 [Belonocnema kinseyi]|uniref:uncharacterized protein LOC117173471 isoform X2 n=1 Tax=Belonocnema kinseyi TaxID=2817044 RepID=UPI00143CE2CF|nr:uncharacterized protein LOC117173471 isoform X2 [Belonocnema kinseyi]
MPSNDKKTVNLEKRLKRAERKLKELKALYDIQLKEQEEDFLPSPSLGNKENIPDVITPGPSSSKPRRNKAKENTEVSYRDMYYALKKMFPDMDPKFIKKKCNNPPFEINGLSKEEQLSMLAEILLNEGDHSQLEVDKDEQYEKLLGIFPQADPTYLRDFVDKNYHIPNSLKNFVDRNLEQPNYPTVEEYRKKIKVTEQVKEYTTQFSIKKFLQIFPDPVAYFENPDRRMKYDAVVNEFLKEIFCKHKVLTISQVYRNRRYHLSLTASDLNEIPPDLKHKRKCLIMPTENVPLLQEMAYVRHKMRIVAFLEEIKRSEAREFEELREKGMLLECQCCFNNECMPMKCYVCEKGHLFCHECILRGTEYKMAEGLTHITCLSSCDSNFSLSVLQEVLPPTTFSILLKKRQEAEVKAAGLEGLVSCPFCHFSSIPPPESKVFKCLNPECMKETCPFCNELNHVPLKCDEVMKPDQARRLLEEKMTEALIRTCYNCKKEFFKEEGCNKMTCVCGASMCYICSMPLEQGEVSKHFNGQGSAYTNLCPLWSDNRRFNAEAVRKVAEITEKEIKMRNPNLQLNANTLLPALPPKTRGPHNDIPSPQHYQSPCNIF